LLEDDAEQGLLLKKWLTAHGHDCEHFESSRLFLQQIRRESFDLLILDWLVPEISGLEVLDWIRENLDWRIPVIFVTAMDREEDIVEALERGADDYMTKPVRERELLARLNALARRASAVDETRAVLDFGTFRIDQQARTVEREGRRIELTQKEYELAVFLFRNCDRVLSRGHILQSVWGRNPDLNTRTVDTHVSRLRTKLGMNSCAEWRLNSIYQHGYRLERQSS
jgi:DNA-binding response OmpR family regulator